MAKPLFRVLQEVSDTDLANIPPGRGGAQFRKFAKSEGASENLKLLVGQSVNTIECNFKVGKNKTWLQLEAIFEQKSKLCYDNLIGN